MGLAQANALRNIRVFLINNQAIIRAGLCLLIGSRPGFEVSGEAGSPEEALKQIRHSLPDVILLDLDVSESDYSLAARLTPIFEQARVIVLTGADGPTLPARAVEMGAVGIVRKDQAPELLLKAIETVHRGELWVERGIMTSLLSKKRRPARPDPILSKIDLLTPREREVIGVVGEGLRNREVGRRLFISEITVRHHLSSIFAKLEVKDRFELIIFAYRNGLIKPPTAR